jgi:hypothetical protein
MCVVGAAIEAARPSADRDELLFDEYVIDVAERLLHQSPCPGDKFLTDHAELIHASLVGPQHHQHRCLA